MSEFVPSKPLKLGTLTALVVGNMIGSGIFLLPSSLAHLGADSLFAWFFTVIGTFVLALVFSRSSQLIPMSGGPFAYAQAGFGRFVGFQNAYCHWIAMWVGNAALVTALIHYLSYFVPALHHPITGGLISIAIIWLLALFNMRGVRPMGYLQVITVFLKLLPILVIVTIGWWHFHPSYILASIHPVTGQDSSVATISAAAGLTLWAFIGVESATVPYDSIENPGRNIPLATLLGTAIAALAYITTSTVVMGMIPLNILQHTATPFAAAGEVIFGPFGKWFMLGGAVISCFGAINGWTFVQGQLARAAAEHGLFPSIFAVKNRFGVPGWGIGITASLISIVLLLTMRADLVDEFDQIIIMASFASLVPYLYTAVAQMIILRKIDANLLSKDLGNFFIAFIASIYAFWALCGTGQKLISYGSILLFTSIILYAWSYDN